MISPETPRYPPGVSRETCERLDIHVRLLFEWQKAKNLVSPASLDRVWTRHVCDSAQIVDLCPEALTWLDLGSGAGFPGLVTAALLAETPGAHVDLVEANSRKCAFLRAVIREAGLPAMVHSQRIESFRWRDENPVDAISARALAPLEKLCSLVAPLMGPKTRAVFHKGQDFVSELENTTQYWGFDLVEHKNRIDETGRIVILSNLRKATKIGQ